MLDRESAKTRILAMASDQGIEGAFKVFYDDQLMSTPDDLPSQVNMELVRVSEVLDQAKGLNNTGAQGFGSVPLQTNPKGVRTMATKTKKKGVNVNSDILKLGNHFYAVKRIECEDVDINKELRSLYQTKHDQHVDNINQGIVTQATEDWNRQIEHIRKFEGKSSVTIPERLFGKPLCLFNNVLLELRVITYAPNEAMTHKGYLRNYPTVLDKLSEFSPTETLIITMKPLFTKPLLVGFSEKNGSLYTLSDTFHTFSGGQVCTGNHQGKDFWALNDENLEREMNRVNYFSPASHRVHVNGNRYDIGQLITNETFVSARRRGDAQWNV